MRPDRSPPVTDLVLVGGGHSHVQVLKNLGMTPLDGVRITVLAREAHTPYSGMLPGYVAGRYRWEDLHIDLGPLCRFAGARLIVGEVTGLDLERNNVRCAGRPPVRFDTLSINCGAAPEEFGGVGAPVKPIGRFLPHWEAVRERARSGVRIVFVGGGAGGAELALAARNSLPRDVDMTIVAPELLPGHGRGAKRMLAGELSRAGIELRGGDGNRRRRGRVDARRRFHGFVRLALLGHRRGGAGLGAAECACHRCEGFLPGWMPACAPCPIRMCSRRAMPRAWRASHDPNPV